MIRRIISGGQTGVDRAALDAGLAAGIAIGGWCPRGRRAEDGRIPDRYPLNETETHAYLERTRLNVEESDGTLILAWGPLTGGTAATRDFACALGRPHLVIDLGHPEFELARARDDALRWLDENAVAVLNVAGPRASGAPRIYAPARAFVAGLIEASAG